jgi:hypothetical protein
LETAVSVIPDVINLHNHPQPGSFLFRLDAALRVKRMRDVYMTEQEASYWTSELIHEVLWSLPDEDIETLNSVPNEDVQMFFNDMIMDLAYAKQVINCLMG